MSQNTPTASSLPLSVSRRLARMEPMFQFLWAILEEEVSEKTERQYRRADARMKLRELLPEQIGANSRRSFNLYRAALVFCSMTRIADLHDDLKANGCSMTSKRSHQLVNLIETEIVVLAEYPPRAKNLECKWHAPAAGRVRKSKRRNLGTLPVDWRLRMLLACPVSSKYLASLLVLTLTGLRPAELAKGVRVVMTSATEITITIRGAKVTEHAGQPYRRLWLSVDNSIARRLAKIVQERGDVDTGLFVSIASPSALTGFVRRLSRRVFKRHKYVVSPYSYRHAFASDLKSEGVAPEDLGAILGHATDKSQRGYGSANQGRPIGRVAGFTATRPVRPVPVSKSAMIWMAEKASLANDHRHSTIAASPVVHSRLHAYSP